MTDLYDLDLAALETLLETWGESPVHARGIWQYLYRACVSDVAHMVDLPSALHARLAKETTLYVPPVLVQQTSPDGTTRKDLLKLSDGAQIEIVLLQYGARHSVCVSTQVGCACGCRFCATGDMGFTRQLSSGEIVAQVLHAQRDLSARGAQLSNFVLMGMGEPLLNYENTLAAIRRLCNPYGMGFVERRITLSTVGIVPGIRQLADEGLRVNLALSLHAATDTVRERLLPINQQYPLDDLFEALTYYTKQTGRRIMVEWVMIADVNDTQEQAEALVSRLAGMPAHVNLIRLNPTATYAGIASADETIVAFTAVLDRARIPHTVRQRRGTQISAGCGQLRSREV